MVRGQPNVLIAIGFVPGIGDAIAKVGKRGLRYLDNNRILKKMGEFLGENIIAPILNLVGDLTAPIVELIKNTIRRKLNEAQEIARRLGEGADNAIDDVMGQPNLATEGAGNVPSRMETEPPVRGNEPSRMEGRGENPRQRETELDIDTPPAYANEVVRERWSEWPPGIRRQYLAAQDRINNGRELVRRMSQGEYDAIFGDGRGAVADVFIEGTESNRVFSIDRVYQFSNSSRNTAEGYERIVRIEMTNTTRNFFRENLVPDNLPGGLRGLRRNPRFKLEGDDYNIVVPRSSWNTFRNSINNHTVEVVE